MENFPSPTGLYKVLSADLHSCHGGNAKWTVGRAKSVRGPLVPCENGIHVCTIGQLPRWLDAAIHPVIKASDEHIDESDKSVYRSITIGPAYPTWNPVTQRLFTADCAEHVLPIFESRYPDDMRPRNAIAASRAYARGDAANAANAYAAASAAYATDAYAAANAALAATATYAAYAAAYAADAAAYAAAAANAAYAAAANAAYAAYTANAERRYQATLLAEYLSGARG